MSQISAAASVPHTSRAAGPQAFADTAPGRWLILLYGGLSYALFFATFLYALGFVGGFVTPTSLDGPRTTPLALAIGVDLALLLLFAVQHSVMARPWFKRWWTQYVPRPAERSTYVLFSSLALLALFALWQPLGFEVWRVEHPVGVAVLYAVFGLGWLTVLVTTFQINHFDLFGLRQVWHHFRRVESTPLAFRTPGPYRVVRHPLYVGWLLGFWAVPVMSASHLLFAVVTTLYILAAIRWEERDLMDAHPEYADYRKRVGMLVPRIGAQSASDGPRA